MLSRINIITGYLSNVANGSAIFDEEEEEEKEPNTSSSADTGANTGAGAASLESPGGASNPFVPGGGSSVLAPVPPKESESLCVFFFGTAILIFSPALRDRSRRGIVTDASTPFAASSSRLHSLKNNI